MARAKKRPVLFNGALDVILLSRLSVEQAVDGSLDHVGGKLALPIAVDHDEALTGDGVVVAAGVDVYQHCGELKRVLLGEVLIHLGAVDGDAGAELLNGEHYAAADDIAALDLPDLGGKADIVEVVRVGTGAQLDPDHLDPGIAVHGLIDHVAEGLFIPTLRFGGVIDHQILADGTERIAGVDGGSVAVEGDGNERGAAVEDVVADLAHVLEHYALKRGAVDERPG